MSTHTYAYRVGRLGFAWKGQRLVLGDVLRGDDARELELPENEHLKQRCARVHDAFFAHHDTPDDDEDSNAAGAAAVTPPSPIAPSASAMTVSLASSHDDAASTADKE